MPQARNLSSELSVPLGEYRIMTWTASLRLFVIVELMWFDHPTEWPVEGGKGDGRGGGRGKKLPCLVQQLSVGYTRSGNFRGLSEAENL